MNEIIEPLIATIITILAATTAIFAIKTLLKISTKKKTEFTTTLKKIIILITIGYISWTGAEIIWTLTETMNIEIIIPEIADILWTAGYPFLMIGFGWLTLDLFTKKQQKTKAIALLITLTILFTLAISAIVKTCPITEGRCVDYTYSVLSITLFILITSINTLLAEIPRLTLPFTLIGVSFFTDFIADITYATSSIELYTLPIAIADGIYAISYLLTTIAFYMLSKRK